MNNRKPTWNYILNDIAFSSLLVKCLYSEYSSSQDKYDLEYQIRLMQEKEDKLQQENQQLKEDKKKAIEYINENKVDLSWFMTTDKYLKIEGISNVVSTFRLLEILGDKGNE